ncbi:MAG: CDP-glycerol glycerophosphotransferase family protein [Chlamydiae bacterium]|nr:CDP-glycerol glycerophosphotransferase family protein [Chlamydiota bacterium]
MDIAGLIVNDSIHYLDHLAPFCALQNWPLILCEPSLASLVKTYYPDVKILQASWRELTLPRVVVSCHPRPFLESCFPQRLNKTAWLPHGNSDKGWKSEVFELLRYEEKIFVYGPKMIDAIREKNGASPFLQIEQVQNFRRRYFIAHRHFYRKLVQKKFPKNAGRKVLLYTPTWNDLEENCSFWKAFEMLSSHLPARYTLLIKLHPNTESAYPAQIERLIGRYSKQSNILWVRDFPPIYPLLEIADGYIGDMSSIGYDFLSRNMPMYFLNSQNGDSEKDPGLYLYRCGIELKPHEYDKLFSIDEETRELDQKRFGSVRKQLYQYTFAEPLIH